MKKRVFYILNIFLILSFQLLALNFTESKKIEEIFEKNKLQGTLVVYQNVPRKPIPLLGR